MDRTRRAGVLLHPTSFPGPHGIGELGAHGRHFLDWMEQAGQTLWQVMPLGPTGYGDSPYQCFSAFAGNPMLIDLDSFVQAGLLAEDDLDSLRRLPEEAVEYGAVIPLKSGLLFQAFMAYQRDADGEEKSRFEAFCQRFAGWLEDDALFMTLKHFRDGRNWTEWPELERDRDEETLQRLRGELAERIQFHKWLQYQFFEQWWALRAYANEKGIQILGDLPLFVAHDSADVWANREKFHLDERGYPTVVAGVPPDYFSETGQRWGNPLYKWDAHRAEGFGWWEARFRTLFEMLDWVRIDHFRGLEAYWEIPASEETAIKGHWVKAPGAELFGTLLGRFSEMNVVAEDLGVITDEVVALRKQFNFPGMRVLQFAWGAGSDNSFLPHNYEVDSVVYTGTHDNNTTVGWLAQEATPLMKKHMQEYMGRKLGTITDEFLRLAYASTAAVAVVPMQDVLALGPEARMNKPGNAVGNWSWRLKTEQLTDQRARALRELATLYGRIEDDNDTAHGGGEET